MILRRTQAAVGVQIVRRSVHMALACMPLVDDAGAGSLLSLGGEAAFPRTRCVALVDGEAGCVPA